MIFRELDDVRRGIRGLSTPSSSLYPKYYDNNAAKHVSVVLDRLPIGFIGWTGVTGLVGDLGARHLNWQEIKSLLVSWIRPGPCHNTCTHSHALGHAHPDAGLQCPGTHM